MPRSLRTPLPSSTWSEPDAGMLPAIAGLPGAVRSNISACELLKRSIQRPPMRSLSLHSARSASLGEENTTKASPLGRPSLFRTILIVPPSSLWGISNPEKKDRMSSSFALQGSPLILSTPLFSPRKARERCELARSLARLGASQQVIIIISP
jgi:hypothetical protein